MASSSRGSVRRLVGMVTPAVALALAFMVGLPARADEPGSPASDPVVVSAPVTPFVVDVDLRDLPAPPEWQPGMPVREVPRREFHPPAIVPPEPEPQRDPLMDLQIAAAQSWTEAFTTPSRNFTGFGYQGLNPSDPVGDVGPSHYIHASNASGSSVIRVYDKSEPTPVQLASTTMSAIGAGTGTCSSGRGDPVVIHDQFADRWLLAEFASSGNTLCVYVSQTADPVSGGWYAYAFTTPSFPDYHKWGVWRDAYGVAANESSPSAYAFNRTAMLAGQPATFQRFTAPDLSGFSFQTLTPADTDGPLLPPAGSPIPFIRHVDNEAHSGFSGPGDYLQLWFMDVDWATPANTTFTAAPAIQVTEFDSSLCGLTSFYCIGKPGVAQGSSSSLDPLREPVMFRYVYRNFGDHEAMVGNLATDVDGSNLAGVRWFELRGSNTSWNLFQEGTYALGDGVNRWMGAIAMDGAGNIALGYSVSNSSSVYPGLRYAGRLAGDPLGTMPQGEASMFEASANNGSNRWGDYASVSVDPLDDCTFWFASKFGGPTTGQWSTRVASFKFDACGTPDFYFSAVPASVSACVGQPAEYTVSVGSVAGFSDPVTLTAPGSPGTVTFTPNPVTPPGSSTLTVSGAAAGSYTFDVVATSTTGSKTDAVDLVVQASTPGEPTLTAPVNGAVNQPLRPAFQWSGSDADTFTIQVATDPGFAAVAFATTTTETTATPGSDLASNTQYYWRVQASNACGDGPYSAVFSFYTEALPGDCGIGTTASVEFFDDLEGGASGWSSSGTGNTWALSTARFYSSTHSYHAVDPSTTSDQRLVSPAVVLPSAASPVTLQFWNWQLMEDRSTGCYDGGLVEISTNDGASWSHLPDAVMLTDPYDGPVSSLGSLDGWCDDLGASNTVWKKAIVDVDAYAGQTVRFRFRLGSDSSVSREGWYVDDVKVQSCQPGGCQAPSGLANNGAVDLNGCANDGVQVTWSQDPGDWGDGGAGTRTYDVLRNGSPLQAGLAYGTTSFTDPTGVNGTAYTYSIRYNNGCGLSSTTGGASAADAVAPATPGAPAVYDFDLCAQTGLEITWNAAPEAAGYDLRVDGGTVVADVTSPWLYDPGDFVTHTYEVRSTNPACGFSAWSPAVSRADGTPAAEVLFCDRLESGNTGAWDVTVP